VATIAPDERTAMRDALRRLLAEHATQADIRRVMAADAGYDPAMWRRLAEMGVLGLIVDPDYGGIGAGPVELELLMEEAGTFLLASPWLSSGVLAAGLLSASIDEDAKRRLLPAIASGERIATVALTGERGGWTPEDVAVAAAETGQGWRLDGVASFVTFAGQADTLLVVAKTDRGPRAFDVDPKAAGLTLTPLQTFDRTQRMARLAFDAVAATPIAGADADALEATMNLALVALAGEQAGAARRVFEMTVDYIKTRVQFGRPVGGFQAIKHMAADLLLEVESATSAARYAAEALAGGRDEARAAIDLAAFACADAFSRTAADAIQMHGGIGFTWEHPAHLYLRRARACAQLFGEPARYRDRYVSALEAAAKEDAA
jgi:alkylation response protein AidB-like acyl-CoA dehydrogenase